MNTEDIKNLAHLSRVKIEDQSLESFRNELEDILAYVKNINEIVTGESERKAENVLVRNVLREDDEGHEVGMYTDDILSQAPETENGYIKVKKIL